MKEPDATSTPLPPSSSAQTSQEEGEKDNFWLDLMRDLAREKREQKHAQSFSCLCPDPYSCPKRADCERKALREEETLEEDHNIPGWARKMAGPWGHRRRFVHRYRDGSHYPFVDIASVPAEEANLEWLVEGFLPKRYLAILGGDSKCGKSWFVTALALSIATGTPFMGLPTPQRNVCWVSFEENEVERRLAFDAWYAAGGKKPDLLTFLVSYERLFIDDPYGLRCIGEVAKGNQCGLIVIDPLHAAYSSGSIVESTTARRVLAGVKQFTKEWDVTVLIIHHLTKQTGLGLTRERMSDSAQILAAASMDWLMEVKEGPRESKGLEGTQEEDGGGKSPSLVTVSRDEGGVGEGDFGNSLPCAAGEGGRRPGGGANQIRLAKVNIPSHYPATLQNGNTAIPAPRLIRLKGRGRGHEVNREWLIESPAPMVYRLAEQNPDLSRTPSERAILAALASGPRTAREIAQAANLPGSTVRNLLAKMVKAEQVSIAGANHRQHIYSLE